MSTEMTVTRAIATQKSLTARIAEGNKLLVLVVPTRGEGDYLEVEGGYRGSAADCEAEIKAGWQRMQDFVKVRDSIRAELVKSNARTTIKIGGKEMTIVEALDFRNSLPERKALLARMKTNATNSRTHYDQAFNRHEAILGQTRNEALNTNKKVDEDFEKNFIAPINLKGKPGLLDPFNISKLIADLEKEIVDFELNINYALSESNAVTKITIEDSGIL